MRRAVECLRTWCAGPPHTCIPETQVWSRNRCCRTTQEGSQAGRHLASAKNVDVVFERRDDVRDKPLAAVVIDRKSVVTGMSGDVRVRFGGSRKSKKKQN